MTKAKRAIGYVRVSTNDQVESGAGLDAQRHAIETYAAKAGFQLVAIHSDDGISGAADLESRHGLAAAIGQLKRGDVLLVPKRDRLGRDVLLTMTIERAITRRGASVVSCDGVGNGTEAADRFMRGVMDAASQFERDLIKARTKSAMAAMRRAGRLTGTVPFGWSADADGVLHPVESEQLVIRRIVACRDAGLTYRQIAQALTDDRVSTKTGATKWTHTTVRSILTRLHLATAA